MIDYGYLTKGVCGLANASKAGTMAGHLGAAVVAGYFFGEDTSELPERVFRGVDAELNRVMAGEEAIWFNAKKAGVTPSELFHPLPKEPPVANATRPVAAALRPNISETRQSGHNVIFASLAIRALHDHPELGGQRTVTGICRLIEGFNNAHAGRGYYGKQKGWLNGNQVELSAAVGFPPYQTAADMVATTIHELIATANIRKQGFGGLWHIINHAAAIVDLERFGFPELAAMALPAHHQHVRLWRTLPDVASELGPAVKADHDPREPVYWDGMLKRDEARLTHRIKTLYGFYTIRRYVQDAATLGKAEDAFLYLMD